MVHAAGRAVGVDGAAVEEGLHRLQAGAGQQCRRLVHAREERVVVSAETVEAQVGARGRSPRAMAWAVWTAWMNGRVWAVSNSDRVAGRGGSIDMLGLSSHPSADKSDMVRSWRLGWSGCSSLKLYDVREGLWTM